MNTNANIASVLLLLLVLCSNLAHAQLRPEAEGRRQLILAQENIEKGNWPQARQNFEAILGLEMNVPAEFYYHYARTLEKTQSLSQAREAIFLFLNDETALSHASYNDALAFLNTIEAGITIQKEAEEKAAAEARKQAEARAQLEVLVQEKTAQAESGNAAAQYELAQWYQEGRNGLAKNIDHAAQWYMKVAKNKDERAAAALYNMGVMYKTYNGRTSESFYREAAVLGHAEALKKLGISLEVLKHTILAEAGLSLSQFNLGYYYRAGLHGLSRNYTEALKWYTQAARDNTAIGAIAMTHIGWLYDNGYGVTKNAVIAELWYLKAAALSYNNALYILAIHYFNGDGGKANKSLAKEYYIRTAWGNTVEYDAASSLQRLFKMKPDKLVKHTLAEARKGNVEAQYALGLWYKAGTHGLKINYAESMQWFTQAAQHTTLLGAQAMNQIGYMWYQGTGVGKREDMALHWFLKAAELGNPEALASLGVFYKDGHGVEKDPDKALEYYKQSLVAGYSNALGRLEEDFGLTVLDLAEMLRETP